LTEEKQENTQESSGSKNIGLYIFLLIAAVIVLCYVDPSFGHSEWDFNDPDSGSMTLALGVVSLIYWYLIIYIVCFICMIPHLYMAYAAFAVYLLLNVFLPGTEYTRVNPYSPFFEAIKYKDTALRAYVLLAIVFFVLWIVFRRISWKYKESKNGIGKKTAAIFISAGMLLFAGIVIYAYSDGKEVLLRHKCRLNLLHIRMMPRSFIDPKNETDCPATIDALFKDCIRIHQDEVDWEFEPEPECPYSGEKYRYKVTDKGILIWCRYHQKIIMIPYTNNFDSEALPGWIEEQTSGEIRDSRIFIQSK